MKSKKKLENALRKRKMKAQLYKIYSKSSSKREVHNNTGLPQIKKGKTKRKISNKQPNLEEKNQQKNKQSPKSVEGMKQ